MIWNFILYFATLSPQAGTYTHTYDMVRTKNFVITL